MSYTLFYVSLLVLEVSCQVLGRQVCTSPDCMLQQLVTMMGKLPDHMVCGEHQHWFAWERACKCLHQP